MATGTLSPVSIEVSTESTSAVDGCEVRRDPVAGVEQDEVAHDEVAGVDLAGDRRG